MSAARYLLNSGASAWKSTKTMLSCEMVALRAGEHCFWLLSCRPPYARESRLSKTQNTQCTKCTKKTQNTQCTRCTKGGRWKMGGGTGQNSGFLNEFSQRKIDFESL